jgi:hypothetical protein
MSLKQSEEEYMNEFLTVSLHLRYHLRRLFLKKKKVLYILERNSLITLFNLK